MTDHCDNCGLELADEDGFYDCESCGSVVCTDCVVETCEEEN